MLSLEEASTLLGVKLNTLTEFSVVDSFNGHELCGYICNQEDHHYGALIILKVNNEVCQQVVYGTPKIHYPFSKDGVFHWPPVQTAKIWEKLDGTNVVLYRYTYRGKAYITYKTRMTPVLRDGKFGNFLSMWKEALEYNRWIRNIANDIEYNMSFELYGYRNPHTVKYDTPLDISLLFYITKQGYILPPDEVDWGFPKTPAQFYIFDFDDLEGAYHTSRNQAAIENKDDLYTEGRVMYLQLKGSGVWRMVKIKPDMIEKIHWTSDWIDENAIKTTAINTYEHIDIPTVEDLVTLLKEEFTDKQIEVSKFRIEKIYHDTVKHMEFVAEVNRVWELAKRDGLDLSKDKNATMRFMSKFFKKDQMRRVGSIMFKNK